MNLNTFLEAKSTELRSQYITFVTDADARSSDCAVRGEQHGSARFAVVVAIGAPVALQTVRPKVMTAAARHGSAGMSFYSPSLVCANIFSLSLSLPLSLGVRVIDLFSLPASTDRSCSGLLPSETKDATPIQ